MAKAGNLTEVWRKWNILVFPFKHQSLLSCTVVTPLSRFKVVLFTQGGKVNYLGRWKGCARLKHGHLLIWLHYCCCAGSVFSKQESLTLVNLSMCIEDTGCYEVIGCYGNKCWGLCKKLRTLKIKMRMAAFDCKLKQNDSDVERQDFLSISSNLQFPLALTKDRKPLSLRETHTHISCGHRQQLEVTFWGKNETLSY